MCSVKNRPAYALAIQKIPSPVICGGPLSVAAPRSSSWPFYCFTWQLRSFPSGTATKTRSRTTCVTTNFQIRQVQAFRKCKSCQSSRLTSRPQWCTSTRQRVPSKRTSSLRSCRNQRIQTVRKKLSTSNLFRAQKFRTKMDFWTTTTKKHSCPTSIYLHLILL